MCDLYFKTEAGVINFEHAMPKYWTSLACGVLKF